MMILFSLFAILLSITIKTANAQYSDLPPPPVKPERFTSKQQLKDYLVKLHEYYAIIGRPRFGRRSSPSIVVNNDDDDDNQVQTSANNNKNTLLMSLLASQQQQQQQQKDGMENLYYESNTSDGGSVESLPTAVIVKWLDVNNNGETTQAEFQNFLNNIYRAFYKNSNRSFSDKFSKNHE